MHEDSGESRDSVGPEFSGRGSGDLRHWLRAMQAESEYAGGRKERWAWNVGIGVAALRLALRRVFTDKQRPFELTVTAMYLCLFSGYIVFHLISQMHEKGISEPWSEAWFPLLLCFWLAMIPALIAIGVMFCDDLARRLVILFALFEIVMALMVAHSDGFSTFRFIKCGCNLAVFSLMFSSRVTTACSWRPTPTARGTLKLSD